MFDEDTKNAVLKELYSHNLNFKDETITNLTIYCKNNHLDKHSIKELISRLATISDYCSKIEEKL